MRTVPVSVAFKHMTEFEENVREVMEEEFKNVYHHLMDDLTFDIEYKKSFFECLFRIKKCAKCITMILGIQMNIFEV